MAFRVAVVFFASLLLMCREGLAYDGSTETFSFWSVELPVNGSVTIDLTDVNIHITKAAFSISGPPPNLNGKWARVMIETKPETNETSSESLQICYLSYDYKMMSEDLDLAFNKYHGHNVTFWLEKEEPEMGNTMPVVLSGYTTVFNPGTLSVNVIEPITIRSFQGTPDVRIKQDALDDPLNVKIDNEDPIDVKIVEEG